MSEPKSKNIVWHQSTVTRGEREQMSGHRGATVWLTGLSGSGKSTVANLLEKALWERGVRSFVLDGKLPLVLYSEVDSKKAGEDKVPAVSTFDSANFRTLARRRMVLAGNRLAETLNAALGH